MHNPERDRVLTFVLCLICQLLNCPRADYGDSEEDEYTDPSLIVGGHNSMNDPCRLCGLHELTYCSFDSIENGHDLPLFSREWYQDAGIDVDDGQGRVSYLSLLISRRCSCYAPLDLLRIITVQKLLLSYF